MTDDGQHMSEQPPPEARLIRLVREAVGLKIPEVAKTAGISKARWSQVESGRETRLGQHKPVHGSRSTIAHMAYAVGLSAERLETEGERPDAAEILREIYRKEDKAGVLQAMDDFAATMKPPGHYQAIDVDPGDVRVIQAKLRDDPQLAGAIIGLMRVLLDEDAQDEQDPKPSRPNGDGQAAL